MGPHRVTDCSGLEGAQQTWGIAGGLAATELPPDPPGALPGTQHTPFAMSWQVWNCWHGTLHLFAEGRREKCEEWPRPWKVPILKVPSHPMDASNPWLPTGTDRQSCPQPHGRTDGPAGETQWVLVCISPSSAVLQHGEGQTRSCGTGCHQGLSPRSPWDWISPGVSAEGQTRSCGTGCPWGCHPWAPWDWVSPRGPCTPV